jgi:hypothetical protein
MKHPAKLPKASILIPTLIIIVAFMFLTAMLTKSNATVINKTTDFSVICQSIDTNGYKNIERHYYRGTKCSFLRLDSLTARQIIEAISKYHRIPVDYRSKKLAQQDLCFAGAVSLDDDIKNIITILNRLSIYVKYDRKKIIAGEEI